MPVAAPGSDRQRLIRRVLCVRGDMRFRIEVEPRFDYGRESHETAIHEHGVVFRAPSLTLSRPPSLTHRVSGHTRSGSLWFPTFLNRCSSPQ